MKKPSSPQRQPLPDDVVFIPEHEQREFISLLTKFGHKPRNERYWSCPRCFPSGKRSVTVTKETGGAFCFRCKTIFDLKSMREKTKNPTIRDLAFMKR